MQGAPDGSGAEAAAGGVREGLGVRIEEQHDGGVDVEVGRELVEKDVEDGIQVEARSDDHVDGVQRREVLKPMRGLLFRLPPLRDIDAHAEEIV